MYQGGLQAYDEAALVYGDVDLNQVAEQRYAAPIIRDSRLWIFRQEINRLAAQRTGEILQDGDGRLTPEQAGASPPTL